MVYENTMHTSEKTVRQSVSLPRHVARRVQTLAKRTRSSANRVIVDLIETGIAVKEREREHFLELAERLARSADKHEQALLKQELARLTFGD
jgi:metal-responsive CopG/Arc/MetJ family transcriptional regulator